MKIEALKCDVCKKNIVLGQMAQRATLDDGRILIVHVLKCKRELIGANQL